MIRNKKKTGCSIAKGTYVGDGTVNRAVAHGLGVTPKFIEILSITTAAIIVIDGATGTLVGIVKAGAETYTQTVPDATNFYVGAPETAGFWGNDDTFNYIWFAWY